MVIGRTGTNFIFYTCTFSLFIYISFLFYNFSEGPKTKLKQSKDIPVVYDNYEVGLLQLGYI